MWRCLLPCLLIRLRHMHMARQKGARHGASVTTFFPELAPGSEFLSNDRVDIDILRDVEVLACRVRKTRRAVSGKPHGRMGLLIRLGSRKHLNELKELPIVGHMVFSPRLDDDLQG